MIPRTKVNYSLSLLARALLVTESGTGHKKQLGGLLQNYLGQGHILLTPSGRGSLYFLLKAIDRPRVLVPAYTCKAVVEAILLAGKQVVHVEVEEEGFNMSISALSEAIDERSVVIATHQFGFPCQIASIVDLCRARGALVIEDVAAAFGSRVNGRLTGTFADAAFFSFDSTKLINVPMKSGFIAAQDAALFDRVKQLYASEVKAMPLGHKLKLLTQAALLLLLENHRLYALFHWLVFASSGKFTMDTPALKLEADAFYTYDMANWQAYIAAEQVMQLDGYINSRRRLYMRYIERLQRCRAFTLPPADAAAEWVCIRFPIRVRGNKLAYYNRAIKRGIDFAFSFTFVACPPSFTRAQLLADSVLDLPFYVKLSDRELDRVASILTSMEGEVEYEGK